MKSDILPILALGALVACGGSYSDPEPEPQPDAQIRVEVSDDDGDDASLDRAVQAAREVLSEEGWTVFRVDRSGADRVVEARRGGDELLRIYVTSGENDTVSLRGWRQKDGEPQPMPPDILSEIQERIRTGT
jgi:hypothetical protein